MLMSAFLFRFRANYLAKMRGYPHFSLWISIALAKIYFFRIVLTWRKNLCIKQVPSLSFQFLIPFIANYFCYFERAMAHQQAVYDSLWFIRKYSGQNLINEALQKFQRTKHCFDFELFTQPFSSQVLLLSSLIVERKHNICQQPCCWPAKHRFTSQIEISEKERAEVYFNSRKLRSNSKMSRK